MGESLSESTSDDTPPEDHSERAVFETESTDESVASPSESASDDSPPEDHSERAVFDTESTDESVASSSDDPPPEDHSEIAVFDTESTDVSVASPSSSSSDDASEDHSEIPVPQRSHSRSHYDDPSMMSLLSSDPHAEIPVLPYDTPVSSMGIPLVNSETLINDENLVESIEELIESNSDESSDESSDEDTPVLPYDTPVSSMGIPLVNSETDESSDEDTKVKGDPPGQNYFIGNNIPGIEDLFGIEGMEGEGFMESEDYDEGYDYAQRREETFRVYEEIPVLNPGE